MLGTPSLWSPFSLRYWGRKIHTTIENRNDSCSWSKIAFAYCANRIWQSLPYDKKSVMENWKKTASVLFSTFFNRHYNCIKNSFFFLIQTKTFFIVETFVYYFFQSLIDSMLNTILNKKYFNLFFIFFRFQFQFSVFHHSKKSAIQRPLPEQKVCAGFLLKRFGEIFAFNKTSKNTPFLQTESPPTDNPAFSNNLYTTFSLPEFGANMLRFTIRTSSRLL